MNREAVTVAVNEPAVMRKVARRLLPFLFLLYIVNLVDRANIGIARLQMVDVLKEPSVGARVFGLLAASSGSGPLSAASGLLAGGLPVVSEAAYGLGAGLFYAGYLLFEVPSNLILRRTGARKWIGRILISWGLVTSCTMFVNGPIGFCLLRVMLGVAEAGFFPGIILYLSGWFRARERARAVALFMIAGPIAGVLGNPASALILQSLNGTGGLPGWQWIFLLEGIPSILLGFVTLFYLTDRPAEAGWLAPAERQWLAARMDAEEAGRRERHGLTFWRAAADPRVALLIGVYFTVALGDNAFGFYLPTILKVGFPAWDPARIGLLAAVPYAVAVGCMVAWSASSDRRGERRGHVAAAAFLAAAGWAASVLAPSPWLALLALVVVCIGMKCMLPVFWTLPTSFLSGDAAAGGIALINSLANVGGFLAPVVMSQSRELTGGYAAGSLCMAAALCFGGGLVFFVRHDS